MRKFKRAGHGKERPDHKGRVIVKIFLQDGQRKGGSYSVKGNQVKTISIDDARVGEVFEAVQKALF